MLDEFLWGTVARISPEAPVPVVQVTRESFHLGGAANVAANVGALGARAVLAGVAGRDAAGERLRTELERVRVDSIITTLTSRPTTVKTRIVAHHQQVVRADRECSDDLAGAEEETVTRAARKALDGCGAVILSDYQKGVVTPKIVRALISRARRRGIPVLVDPKVRHLPRYRGATIVTPNQQEAADGSGIAIRNDEDLFAAGRALLRKLNCQAVLITRGEDGMTLFERDESPIHIPTAAQEVFDVTGAGDTVIATLALALAAGAALPLAAALANAAAGIVVGKLGTATTSPEEVLASTA